MLLRTALSGIGMTDDGGTIYVHLFPKEGSAKARGRAFVLAWQDYAGDPPQCGWAASVGSLARRS